MSECPHKQLKKQMVGEQVWYACECGQKFRVEPWDGRVRLVEGLKVEEGRESLVKLNYVQRWHPQIVAAEVLSAIRAFGVVTCQNEVGLHDAIAKVVEAAQHLKREQEGRCTCVVMTPRNIYPGGRHLDDSCPVHTIQPREQEPTPGELRKTIIEELYKRHNGLSPQWIDDFAAFVVRVAAQPPQELVSPLLHEPSKSAPLGCHCPPNECKAPVIMGRQMPCRREKEQK